MESSPLLPIIDESPELHRQPGYKHKFRSVVFYSRSNVLLVLLPLALTCGYYIHDPIWTFSLNFLAVIPLAAILSYATEELADQVGQTIGGLLSATFGNAVELILSVIALRKGEIRLVQASMLGSILSNILLVLGCCFLAGGINRIQQKFNQTVAQTMSSLMCLAVCALLIPAAVRATVPDSEKEVLSLSRGTSIIMLAIYIMYLVFQLRTHTAYFDECAESEPQEPNNALSSIEAVILLGVVAVVVSFCTANIVDSIDPIVASTGMTKTFIGLILLPIIGNVCEHATSVIVAMKDKMDLACGVAIGSAIQISLFMTPFLVILGWVIDQPMSLYFSTFETAILFVSVFITNSLVLDGESNWLEGALLLGVYAIVAIAFFYLPD